MPVVVVYDTEVRAGGQWHKAPRLMVHLDRGESSDLTELAWCSDGGAEAVVAFDDGMAAFRGHRRSAEGSSEDYRGVECERRPALEGAWEDRVRVFVTEEDRDADGGDGDTVEGRLSLLLDDGRGAVERVTWRDRRGTFASLTLRRPAPPAARGTVPVTVTKVVAGAENRRAGEVAANLLGAGRGKWLAFEATATLDFALPEPTVVTAYRLTAANDYRDRDPRDWRLRGSVDGHTWITLDSRLDQAFPQRHQVREYAVANSTPYPLYRLDIGRNWGRQAETQLNRVELLTTDDAELIGTPVTVTRVEASGEHRLAGEVAANLLDAGGGKWLTFSSTATLDFLLAKPDVVTAYTLTSADDHCSRDPKDWVLRGSQDGRTWVTVDRRSGEMFTERFLAREFTPPPRRRTPGTGWTSPPTRRARARSSSRACGW
ncbi:coagulation factor 5/8 type domain-containing protein [Streptomyces sp. NPDC033538]|uniref:coagulation factor 5/8 type domain-containing protein n=1 Tax=Streptomyces sp. NPDC033538 TaxID=3155367 RepID=UPI0033D9106D